MAMEQSLKRELQQKAVMVTSHDDHYMTFGFHTLTIYFTSIRKWAEDDSKKAYALKTPHIIFLSVKQSGNTFTWMEVSVMYIHGKWKKLKNIRFCQKMLEFSACDRMTTAMYSHGTDRCPDCYIPEFLWQVYRQSCRSQWNIWMDIFWPHDLDLWTMTLA